LRLSLASEWIEGLNTFKNFLHAVGFLAGDFGVDEWIDPAPLQDVLEALRHARTAPGRARAEVSSGSSPRPPVYH
jgi:hypothetical protein